MSSRTSGKKRSSRARRPSQNELALYHLRWLVATIPVTAFNDSRLPLEPDHARAWLEERRSWPWCKDKIKPEDIAGPKDFMRTESKVAFWRERGMLR